MKIKKREIKKEGKKGEHWQKNLIFVTNMILIISFIDNVLQTGCIRTLKRGAGTPGYASNLFSYQCQSTQAQCE